MLFSLSRDLNSPELLHVGLIIVLGAEQHQHQRFRLRFSFLDGFFRVGDVALVAPGFGLARLERLAQPGPGGYRIAAEPPARALFVTIDFSVGVQDIHGHNPAPLMPAATYNLLAIRSVQLGSWLSSFILKQILH